MGNRSEKRRMALPPSRASTGSATPTATIGAHLVVSMQRHGHPLPKAASVQMASSIVSLRNLVRLVEGSLLVMLCEMAPHDLAALHHPQTAA